MNSEAIEYALYTALFLAAMLALACVICACVYDIMWALKKCIARPVNKATPKAPHITILIYVEKSCTGLDECLRSIAANQYHSYDILVVDNMSGALVRRQTARIINNMPHLPIYSYKNRHKSSIRRACQEGYKRSRQGEHVLLITPDVQLPPQTLHQLAETIQLAPNGMLYVLPLMCSKMVSIEAIYPQLKLTSQDMIWKVRATFFQTNTSRLIVGGVYARHALRGSSAPWVATYYVPRLPLVINPSAAWQYARQRDGRFSTFVRIIMAIIIGTCIWMAATTDSNYPLLVAWGIITAWTVASLFQTEHLSSKTRLHLLASAWITMYVYAANYIVRIAYRITNLGKKRTIPAIRN